MTTLEKFRNHPVLAEILEDNFGGVLYDVRNRDKYDDAELIALYNELNASEKGALNGLEKGALNFITGK